MEDRKEYKFEYSNIDLKNFYKTLSGKLINIYPERKITSIYLDTKNYDIYRNSLLNDVDKFKVRYRKYSNDKKIYFEIKKNTKLGKQKIKKVTDFNNLNQVTNIFYKNYFLESSLLISYIREYYSLFNTRITIDKNIKFENTSNRSLNKNIVKFNKNIVEYKLLNSNPDIEKYFLSNPKKFSKYETGLKEVYNI